MYNQRGMEIGKGGRKIERGELEMCVWLVFSKSGSCMRVVFSTEWGQRDLALCDVIPRNRLHRVLRRLIF